jgi:hypothetical protein
MSSRVCSACSPRGWQPERGPADGARLRLIDGLRAPRPLALCHTRTACSGALGYRFFLGEGEAWPHHRLIRVRPTAYSVPLSETVLLPLSARLPVRTCALALGEPSVSFRSSRRPAYPLGPLRSLTRHFLPVARLALWPFTWFVPLRLPSLLLVARPSRPPYRSAPLAVKCAPPLHSKRGGGRWEDDCIKNVVLLRGYKEASFCQAGWQKHRRFSGSVVGSSDKGEGRGKNATRTHREYCRAF